MLRLSFLHLLIQDLLPDSLPELKPQLGQKEQNLLHFRPLPFHNFLTALLTFILNS